MHGYFDNSLKLTRFILRRDRLTIILWVVILVAFSALLAPGMNAMFPDQEARLTVANIYDNPLMVSMMGPVYGLDNPETFNAGAMYSGFMLIWVILAVALMNLFFVVRHTRADEERGRSEVVRSLPVGRLANLNATMISAAIINTALALLTGVGIAVTGVEGMDWGGSMLYGVARPGLVSRLLPRYSASSQRVQAERPPCPALRWAPCIWFGLSGTRSIMM
jgi:ABC-2 type transport system permease protein